LRRFRTAVGQASEDGTLKTCNGFPHGMPTTEAETVNADLLGFIKG
jgi:non-heme chloroperoxidase